MDDAFEVQVAPSQFLLGLEVRFQAEPFHFLSIRDSQLRKLIIFEFGLSSVSFERATTYRITLDMPTKSLRLRANRLEGFH